MSTLQDTDLLLVNRAGVDYKCTFADWKASQTGVRTPTITSPSAGAVDLGATPTFTSSAFAGTGVTHVSSDWQVTLATDAAFASPVVQSMADATHKVSWDGGPLKADTDYIVRVRHNGTGGSSSAWSAVVAFKTKKAFILAMKPGDAYKVAHGTTVLAPCSSPSKLINLATVGYGKAGGLAAGVDGKVYVCPSNSTTFTLDTTWKGYDVVATAGDDYSEINPGSSAKTMVLTSAGDAVFTDGGPKVTCPEKVTAIGCFGMYNRVMWAVGQANNLYAIGTKACLGVTVSETGFTKISLTGIPTNVARIKQVASYTGKPYEAGGLLVLLDNGDLWHIYASGATVAPGIPTTTAPLSPGVKFTMIATAGGTYGNGQGVSALADNGDVYWSSLPNSISWGIFTALGKCRSPIFGGYGGTNDAFVLKDDGFIYISTGNTTFTKADYSTNSVPTTPISSLGSVPFSMTSDSKPAFLIIPS